MASYSVALPLELDDGDGFVMIKSIKKLIRQNLKMLLLTGVIQLNKIRVH